MTERKYDLNRWHPHDGGPCPVMKKTKVRMFYYDGCIRGPSIARDVAWSNVVAFCVTEYPDEEETRTGRCKASLFHERPEFWGENTPGKLPVGTYTATIVNGEVQEIHWRKDQ
jgi:hypothetical protein